MAAKQRRPTEAARRRIQRGRDTLANAVQVTLGLPEGDVARNKPFTALSVPKGGRTVRKRPTGPPRHWPSPSSTKKGRP